MYTNSVNSKKNVQVVQNPTQHSPIDLKTNKPGSIGSAKIVPAQLSRAFMQERQN